MEPVIQNLLVWFVTAVIGILSGVASAYCFLMFYLDKRRPKIEISKHICKVVQNPESDNPQLNYYFKFVNRTNTDIFDVRVEPTFFKPIYANGRKNIRATDIQLKDNFIAHIPCDKKDDIHDLHAYHVRTTEDIESNWGDESSYLKLKIVAKHSLTGLSKVFHEEFSKNDITTKQFLSGNDLGVK